MRSLEFLLFCYTRVTSKHLELINVPLQIDIYLFVSEQGAVVTVGHHRVGIVLGKLFQTKRVFYKHVRSP